MRNWGDITLRQALPFLAFVPMVLAAFAFQGFANAHSGGLTDRSTWNDWCRDATRIEVKHTIEDSPLNNEREFITTQEYGASQMQNPSAGYVICDDGTKISPIDGHKL